MTPATTATTAPTAPARTMRVDGRLDAGSLDEIAAAARAQERSGYGATWTSETAHDPFLPLMPAAESTERLGLGTAIAVMFARNPMSVAYIAHDLQRFTGGRFALGLGTQVRGHIRRRFSMPWSVPVTDRVREFVAALRAIHDGWEQRQRPTFEGRFYQHTLMTPFFTPQPHGFPCPPIYLAVVGQRMAALGGEIADGVFTHSFTTPRYLRERVVPAISDGAMRVGRTIDSIEVNCRGFVATGETDEDLENAVSAVRAQIAFYASTPAYRAVLDLHGWAELGDELHTLSTSDRADRWTRMADLIDDNVLEEFAVVGAPRVIAPAVLSRFGGLADAYRFYTPYQVAPELLDDIAGDISALQSEPDKQELVR